MKHFCFNCERYLPHEKIFITIVAINITIKSLISYFVLKTVIFGKMGRKKRTLGEKNIKVSHSRR